MATPLEEELSQTVVITENGERRRLSKGALVIKQIVNKRRLPVGIRERCLRS